MSSISPTAVAFGCQMQRFFDQTAGRRIFDLRAKTGQLRRGFLARHGSERLNTRKPDLLRYRSQQRDFAEAGNTEFADCHGSLGRLAEADTQDDALLVGGVFDGRTCFGRLSGRRPERQPPKHGCKSFAFPKRADQLA
jgi:hypothetical protein